MWFIVLLEICSYLVVGSSLQDSSCPLWHTRVEGTCECTSLLGESVLCDEDGNVTVLCGNCMTWDNLSHEPIINTCPISVTCINKSTIVFQRSALLAHDRQD